jgi:hypothetical protein
MVTVKTYAITYTKNGFKGCFKLSDGTKTKFDYDRKAVGGWSQWGNSSDNLKLTVGRVEKLVEEFHNR